jgi:hypothetical protein
MAMKLQDFIKFEPFNELRQKVGTTKLGYFELFDPIFHLTGLERSELELNGRLLTLEHVKTLPDKTLAIKNSRVLVYYPDENWYRDKREFPTYHLAYCSQLDEFAKSSPNAQWLATTRLSEDYDLVKLRSTGQVTLVSHSFVVCKHCLHTLGYKNFDEFRNRRRGYSETVLNQFRLADFFKLYQQYPLSFKGRPSRDKQAQPG